jgi:hypothetical protein
MTTTTKTICDLAAEFDRLSPSQVDTSLSGNGQQEAGHIGHEAHDDCHMATVGWFCAGGSVGNPVLRIHEDDIAAAVDRLASLPDGAMDNSDISVDAVLTGLRYSELL